MGNIIKADNVILKEFSETINITKDKKDEPQIIINKKDDIIESIDVICSCGKKIYIICKYEE